jgi:hypothetical protein
VALSEYQRGICQLIAANRRANGESYIAGGVALNTLLKTPRLSRDIDLFHDTDAALVASWLADRQLLQDAGYAVVVVRETAAFVEAVVSRDDESVLMQWARDSAFRFFPLVENDLLGLVLHPFDLATNKVLALAGRLEARDWIDVLNCHEYIQPLGYLVWAACGKDPGFSPTSLIAAARRSSRYSQVELDTLAFAGTPPDARVLGAKWHVILQDAADICDLLPTVEVGKCVITTAGELYQGMADGLRIALENRSITFHAGTIRGVWPQIKGAGHE